MNKYKLSTSSLKLMKECPACFWWQVKKGVRRPSGPMSQLPNRVEDQILNRFKEFRAREELPPELSELNGMKLLKDLKLHDDWKNKGKHYIDEEKGFDLVAKPDDVLENGKKYVILDYKTAGAGAIKCTPEKFEEDIKKYDYNLQADVYNFVFQMTGMETEDYAYFLFWFIKEIDSEGRFIFGTKLMKAKVDISNAEKTVNDALEILKLDTAPKSRCPYCLAIENR